MYGFPEDLKKSYESSPLSFVYYQNIDGKAVPVLASDGFCKNVGMENEDRRKVLEWLETGLFERMHPDDVGFMKKVSNDFLLRRGPYDAIFRCKLGNRYEWIHGFGKWQTLPGGTETAVIGYANMSSFKKQMMTVLGEYGLFRRDSFYTDPLTGLPNSNYLHEYAPDKINVMLKEGKRPSVVYSDVYSMVSYNNHYGFKEGDRLLCLVAETLKGLFPEDLLVRGANDHFFLITGISDDSELADRLESANETIKKEAMGNTLGIRSGICSITEEWDLTDAMDRARKAMRGINDDMNRSCAFFSQAAVEKYWNNRYIIENFSNALENGWIKVFYQAIMRVDSGKVAAFEALARWLDPIRGTITPSDFIPSLQRYHQLYKLDLYMMEQVFREVKNRHDSGLPILPVSVNFSRQDFDHADIAEAIEALYVKYDIEKYAARNCFIVEVTEQDIAVGTESFRKQLQKIRSMGYLLWLDDFGSGYSALNMFSHYDFDLIKYDMDLIRHLNDHGGTNRLILRALVNVARELGVHTLTEGVEEEEQLSFIREIGCELGQGFLFSRPMPLDEILYRLHNGEKSRPCEEKEERERYAQQLLHSKKNK